MTTVREIDLFITGSPATAPHEQAVETQFRAVAEQLRELDEVFHAAWVTRLGSTEEKRKLRKEIRSVYLLYIHRAAVQAAVGRPALLERYALPAASAPDQEFLTTASHFATVAREDLAELAPYGLDASVLDEFDASLAKLGAVMNAAHDARLAHINARAMLGKAMRELNRVVKVLDSIMRRRHKDDPAALTAWRAAKSIIDVRTAAKPDAPPAEEATQPPA